MIMWIPSSAMGMSRAREESVVSVSESDALEVIGANLRQAEDSGMKTE
jgi:hypothetical protein